MLFELDVQIVADYKCEKKDKNTIKFGVIHNPLLADFYLAKYIAIFGLNWYKIQSSKKQNIALL